MVLAYPMGFAYWLRVLFTKSLRYGLGSGVLTAITGIGVGDIVVTSLAGARYGLALWWAVLLGVGLKYLLSEHIARWQLATGTSLVHGWQEVLGPAIPRVFLIYLLAWSATSGAALLGSIGLAAHTSLPFLAARSWSGVHLVLAALIVSSDAPWPFERAMKALIVCLFGAVFLVVSTAHPELPAITHEAFSFPKGAGVLLAVLGGVGGSVSLLSYGYWKRVDATKPGWRKDLLEGYVLTAVFALTILWLSARSPSLLQTKLFLACLWAAACTALLGTWRSLPPLFEDLFRLVLPRHLHERSMQLMRGWLLLGPVLLLARGEPLGLVSLFARTSGVFLPFLAGSLLLMRSGSAKRQWTSIWFLAVAVVVFTAFFLMELLPMLSL